MNRSEQAPLSAAPGAVAPAWLQLEVRHETLYRYAAPVSLAHHLAHLRPIDDAGQRLHAHTLEVEPPPSHRLDSADAWGNRQCHFGIVAPHDALRVVASSRLSLAPRFARLQAAGSPTVAELAGRLRYVARAAFEPALEFVLPSPYVPRLPALREYGAALLQPGRPAAEAALALMQRIHAEFRYESRSTEIDTPLAQVMLQRRGVCQDFAHLLIGVLRAHGLAARYVSGYLLTHAPAGDDNGGAAMLGADASHAWVQLWCPGTPGVPADGWLGLDPTNNCVPATGHVRVATGRDFGDVTPLRGVIRGGGAHTLAVGVSTRLVPPGPEGAAAPGQAPELLTPGPMEPTTP